MASFLSALNTRDDGYGGAPEDRMRLPREVLAAVRGAVGGDFVVGCRLLADEAIAGGTSSADAAGFAVTLGRAGADYLSLSAGGKFEDARQPSVGEAAYPYTGASGAETMPTVRSDEAGPFGRHLPAAAAIRRAVRAAGLDTPVVAAGGITTFALAEAALARGDADFVASARQSLADPDWFLEDAPRPRRRDPPLPAHELLRGARPAPQARDLPALGSPQGRAAAPGRARMARRAAAHEQLDSRRLFVRLDDGVAEIDLARAIGRGRKASRDGARDGRRHGAAAFEFAGAIDGVLRARLPARERLVELLVGNHGPSLSQE